MTLLEAMDYRGENPATRPVKPPVKKPQPEARIRNAEKRDAEFRADCRAADAAGLSYGQYMLQKASKKPAGAATPTSRKK